MNKKELLTAIFKGLPDNVEISRQALESIIEVMFSQMQSQLKMGHPLKSKTITNNIATYSNNAQVNGF